MEAVAGRLHHVTLMVFDRVAQQLVVTRQRGAHRVGVLLPESGRAFEIGDRNVTVPVGSPAIALLVVEQRAHLLVE